MPGGRRGLVAPQNTFLDTLIKRSAISGSGGTCFLLANAQGGRKKQDSINLVKSRLEVGRIPKNWYLGVPSLLKIQISVMSRILSSPFKANTKIKMLLT